MLSELFIHTIGIKPHSSSDSYADQLPAVLWMETHILALKTPVTFFVGENGMGKSTLLEALAVACGFNAEGGSRNFNFSTKETHTELYRRLDIGRGVRRPRDGYFLRAESFYNVASELERLDEILAASPKLTGVYGGKSLHNQSHGESFLSLVLNRFRGGGLYLLDEPEAALSPSRQLALLAAIHSLVGEGAQFLIATHSPMLMAYPNAEVYVLDDEGICKTAYQETEHYTVTKAFLNAPEKMLRYLLESDPK